MSDTTPIDAEKPTMTEVTDSLTGYDEIAITQQFDRDFAVLLDFPTTLGRALIFILKRRDGLTDKEAKREVMNMRLGDVNDYFAEDPDDVEDPDTTSGEDDSQPA